MCRKLLIDLTWSRQVKLLGKLCRHGSTAVVTGSSVEGKVQTKVATAPDSALEKTIDISLGSMYQRALQRPDQPEDAKILRVAILGAVNAGKSTLTNKLIEWRVNSVSSKIHTTRWNTMSVFTQDNTQIVFTDTPGILNSRRGKKRPKMDSTLKKDPERSFENVDLVGVVVDASDKWTRNQLCPQLLKMLYMHRDIPSVLILNKALVTWKLYGCIESSSINVDLGNLFAPRPSGTQKVDAMKTREMLLHITRVLTEGIVDNKPIPYKSVKQRNSHKEQEQFNSDNFFNYLEEKYKSAIKSHQPIRNNDSQGTSRSEGIIRGDMKGVSSAVDDSRGSSITMETEALETEAVSEDTDQEDKQLAREAEQAVRDKVGWPGFRRVFMTSATQDEGVQELRQFLLGVARPGDWEHHSSLVTDQDPRQIAKDCVWEKLLDNLQKEIPYQLHPEIMMWELDREGTLLVAMKIPVYSQNVMNIALRDNGQILRKVKEEAKQEMRNTFRREVRLFVKFELEEKRRRK